jgi:pyruvate dehydrogenase E2 component (dihydrolipoamide acetyltransferase)
MESPADGILSGVRAKLNDVIPVTEVIAYILAPGEALPGKVVPQQVLTISAPPRVEITTALEPAVTVAKVAQLDKVRVTPVARRLAQELHLDLTQISGRGPRGRIHKADVLAFQKSQSSAERPVFRWLQCQSPQRLRQTLRLLHIGSIHLPDTRRK